VSEQLLQLSLPPELVEAIAQRAADILVEREAAAAGEERRWLTIPDAMAYTGFPRQWFYDARSSGRLAKHGAGRKAVIDRHELDALIEADAS
jgi:hypothetical protein